MSNLSFPVSIQERMTETILSAYMDLIPKGELIAKATEVIDMYFHNVQPTADFRVTPFQALVFKQLNSIVSPIISELLSSKNEEFKKQLNEVFLQDVKQLVNGTVDNMTVGLAMASSRAMVQEIMAQAHMSAISGCQNAVSRYGGPSSGLVNELASVMGANFPYCNGASCG